MGALLVIAGGFVVLWIMVILGGIIFDVFDKPRGAGQDEQQHDR